MSTQGGMDADDGRAPEEAAERIPHELTIEEAVAFAILLQKDGQTATAAEVYRRVLQVAPDHPTALHYSGVLAHQEGRTEDALGLIERSLAIAPDRADWHSNRGIVLQSAARLDEAIEAYRRAIALDAAHPNAYSNLGVVLRLAGRPSEAEAAYRTAIQLDPEHVDAHTNLGVLLNSLNRTDEAAACFCRAITLRPHDPDARRLLVLAHCTLGEKGEAVRVLEEWLADEPDDPIAVHMLAACTGRDVPLRASNEFVEKTFDNFAVSFESKLERLSYRAPALVSAMVAEAGMEPGRCDVLDAGCGTGLCGALLAPFARRLVGVDLSSGMLARAGEKNVYDALVKAELTEYLEANTEAFDVIVSADALVYFGGLERVLGAAARALRPDGILVFTLEHAAAPDDMTYRLEMHGRFSHGRGYVTRLLGDLGLRPELREAELRMEAGRPVAGLVVRATKPVLGDGDPRKLERDSP